MTPIELAEAARIASTIHNYVHAECLKLGARDRSLDIGDIGASAVTSVLGRLIALTCLTQAKGDPIAARAMVAAMIDHVAKQTAQTINTALDNMLRGNPHGDH